jgi:hypothetical protein
VNDFDFLTGTWDVANRWRIDFLDAASPVNQCGQLHSVISGASWPSCRV